VPDFFDEDFYQGGAMSNKINRREFTKEIAVKSGSLSAIAAAPVVASELPKKLSDEERWEDGFGIKQAFIEISFSRGGKFVAELRLEGTPKTCEYFLERVPFTLPARRASMSGGIIAVPLEGWDMKELENVNTMLPEGDIGFLTAFLPHRPMNRTYCQFLIPTSGRSQAHQMWGTSSPVNKFGKIVEGEMDEIRAIASRMANEGADPETCTVKAV
tara:strand:- start:233 stop:877 length:645 start_codon:yes stop_codon:yes gene_type:complete